MAENNDNIITGNEPDDIKLRLTELFEMVDKAYPSKTIVNLHRDNHNIARRAVNLSETLGYENTKDFFEAYGYTYSSGGRLSDIAREKVKINHEDYVFDNSSVLYSPGNEPEKIRKRIDILLPKLAASYPDREVRRLGKEHKKWYETVCELRKLLGYENNKAFLAAYGFYLIDGNVEQKADIDTIVAELKRRYENKPLCDNLKQFKEENSDLPIMGALLHRVSKDYGMTLKEFLLKEGLLTTKESQKTLTIEEKKAIINEFVDKWESKGCKQYSSVAELFEKCEYIGSRVSFNNCVKATYGISGKDYLEIAGVVN